ncbi:hypothetical protein Nmel_001254 [Mimus melanotis]
MVVLQRFNRRKKRKDSFKPSWRLNNSFPLDAPGSGDDVNGTSASTSRQFLQTTCTGIL